MEKRGNLRVNVSKYMSFLLRHNPQDMRMDADGFVEIEGLLEKLGARYAVEKKMILEIAETSGRRRFEINGGKIRALYGHTISVRLEYEEDKIVTILYHGTTKEAAERILKEGLKPMRRKFAHLSPSLDAAIEVGRRRAERPIVLEIDVGAARANGYRFYKATDRVYLCGSVPPKYMRIAVE